MTNDLVTCPHRDCGEDLHVIIEVAYTLSAYDFDETEAAMVDGIRPAHAYTSYWKVECSNGHVILVPDPHLGCPCPLEAQELEERGCTHNPENYDHSDEYRTFRPHDTRRLLDTLHRLRAAMV